MICHVLAHKDEWVDEVFLADFGTGQQPPQYLDLKKKNAQIHILYVNSVCAAKAQSPFGDFSGSFVNVVWPHTVSTACTWNWCSTTCTASIQAKRNTHQKLPSGYDMAASE